MSEWKEIPGYAGKYRISEVGCVQTCTAPGSRSRGDWRDMSTPFESHGYRIVYLWNRERNRPDRRLVHQLVAENFIGPRPADCDATNHMDGNKDNNHFTNLEWCSRSDNMRHAWRTGLCKPQKLTEENVKEILSCGGLDTDVAGRFGVSQVMVTRIRAGKAWKHVSREMGVFVTEEWQG